jgi:hypothetical protein
MRVVRLFLYQIQSQFTFIKTSNHLLIKCNVLMKQLHLNCLMHKLEGMCISQEEVRPGFLYCFFWPNSIYSGCGSFCCAFFFHSKYILTFVPNFICVILYFFYRGGGGLQILYKLQAPQSYHRSFTTERNQWRLQSSGIWPHIEHNMLPV